MNDRERLIELLDYVACNIMEFPDEGFIVALADHLISHGVTVQKHGRWDTTENTEDWLDVQIFHHVHKECKYAYTDANCAGHNYCPNCGAIMEKGEA